jgi:hypothetical protein
MLKLGWSRPWRNALEALTGSREMQDGDIRLVGAGRTQCAPAGVVLE